MAKDYLSQALHWRCPVCQINRFYLAIQRSVWRDIKFDCLPAIRSLERRARYLVYCMYVCLFVCSVNDFSTTRGPIHAKVCMQAYSGSGCVFSPLGGWRPPAGGKGANEIFVTMGVNGEFLHFGGF